MRRRLPIRVLVAEDHPDVRAALVSLIESDEELELAAAVGDAAEAVELAAREQPDVALVDVRMPAGGGLAAARGIAGRSPNTRMIALSAAGAAVPEALEPVLVGRLVKGSSINEIIASVKRAAELRPAGSAPEGAETVVPAEPPVEDEPMHAENGRVAEELRVSRARIAASAAHERVRLERDLHDGAQQRLMTLQVKLGLAAEQAPNEELAGLLEEIARDAARAVEELRALAQALYPPILSERGVGDALRSFAMTAPIAVSVREEGSGRYSSEVEAALYFSAVEAIQHAGTRARVTVTLEHHERGIQFEITAQGVGSESLASADGDGLVGMRDRVAAIGGELELASSPDGGARVWGSVSARSVEKGA